MIQADLVLAAFERGPATYEEAGARVGLTAQQVAAANLRNRHLDWIVPAERSRPIRFFLTEAGKDALQRRRAAE